MRHLTDWEYGCLNSDWIKVAGWDRTFSDEEHHLLETFRGCSRAMCAWVWLLQRQYRLTHGKLGAEIVADTDLHEALLLMRAAGIPCDRMHPDDDWEFPGHMKEPVP
jgi:hypothetical protein